MKKIFFHPVVLFLFVTAKLLAQPGDPGLQIGDRVPNISMGHLLNEPGRKIKFSDFKGKLLILDFWGVHCGICISNMPKIDSLQKEFNGKVQFVYVTRDTEKAVNDLLKKRRMKQPGIPFIVNDVMLDSLFPHTGNPLHVWITPKGMVKAITEHHNTNEHTITAFLDGENIQLPRRWDWGFNMDFPIVSEQNSALLQFSNSYSIWLNGDLSNNCMDAPIQVIRDKANNNATGLRLVNKDITYLFGFAFMSEIFQVPINYTTLYKNNRIIMELKDSTAFVVPGADSEIAQWKCKNLYSYELKLPPGSDVSIFDQFKRDLSIKFPNYKASVENRKAKCIVLSDLSVEEQRKARSNDTTLRANILYRGNGINVQNMPVNTFLEHLIYTYSYYDTPFISETSFKGNLQMSLGAKPFEIEPFNKELNKYGFKVSIEEREIKMLVIRDSTNEIAAQ